MKIFKKDNQGLNQHVKTVPEKYEPIKEKIDLIVSLKAKRLTDHDRRLLDHELLKHFFAKFLEELKKSERLAFDYLQEKGDEVSVLKKITRRDGSHDFRVFYKNGIQARVLKKDFKGVEFKTESIY